MKRRLFISLVAALALRPALALTQGIEDIRFEATPLAGNVFMLASRAGGNLAVCVGEDGVLLVDSDYEQLAAKTREAVASITEKPVRWVVNTHWHFDHVGGNAGFAETGAEIVAHASVPERMAVPRHIAIIDVDVPASPPEALPTRTYADSLTLRVAGEEILLLHPPSGHTDGDTIVQFRNANVIHVGDLMFQGGYPFIDVSAGGNIDGVIRAIEAVLPRCDENTRIVPGHGALADVDQLANYAAMLRDFRDGIAGEMSAGRDLEAIRAGEIVKSLDEKWGSKQFPVETFTEIVFRSLGGS